MRSPWDGIGGYMGQDDGLGADDFVLVSGVNSRATATGDVCVAISRVQYPKRLDEGLIGDRS